MKSNERLDALKILCALLEKKVSLSTSLAANPKLSPFSKALCFGICRQFLRLTVLAEQLVTKKPKQTDVWLCLLMGLYELHFLHKPDYAVVKESVDLVVQLKKTWAKGLVNAVLRSYCRQQSTLIDTVKKDERFQLNHPQWLVDCIQTDWPQEAHTILEQNDQHPPMTLRVNTRHESTEHYLYELAKAGLQGEACLSVPSGIVLASPCAVTDLPGFEEGLVSVQDGAAQLAATLLDLKPGLRILDACCAPGGKTSHILEQEPQLDECVALDIDPIRLRRVQDNLTRLQLEATLCQGDAADPYTWWDGVLFDRILLDAPCSATGVIRRHPDIKYLRTPEEVATIVESQQTLLEALWPLLAPGGRLVYATCSILSVENEQQIAHFIARHADCVNRPYAQPWGHQTPHGWQILPGEQQMDGFFYSVLSKLGVP